MVLYCSYLVLAVVIALYLLANKIFTNYNPTQPTTYNPTQKSPSKSLKPPTNRQNPKEGAWGNLGSPNKKLNFYLIKFERHLIK